MKFPILLLPLLAVSAASAFDSEAWLAKRAVLSEESVRLRRAYDKYSALSQHPSEAVTVTLEQFPDGTAKTVLFAGQAVFFREEKFLWAKGLVIRKYDRGGEVVARIDADKCVIDQTTKSGWCPEHAVVTRKGSRFEGDGVYFSAPESYVSVCSASDLRSSDTKMEALQ